MKPIPESTHIFNIIFQIVDKATKQLASIDKNLKKISGTMDAASKGVKKLHVSMLNIGLGLTFFMFGVQMQLKRMLSMMFKTFEEASGSTSGLIEKFNIVRANLGAISIAFWDAFAQSGLFEWILGLVQQLTDWFVNLTDEEKKWAAIIPIASVGIIQVIGDIGQAVLGFYILFAVTPIIIWAIAIVIALGILAYEFITKKDKIKTHWDNLISDMTNNWVGGFDKMKLAVIDLSLLVLDVLPIIEMVLGMIGGALIGSKFGAKGAAIGAIIGGGVGYAMGKATATADIIADLENRRSAILGKSMPTDVENIYLRNPNLPAETPFVAIADILATTTLTTQLTANTLTKLDKGSLDTIAELQKLGGETSISDLNTTFTNKINSLIDSTNSLANRPINLSVTVRSSTTR